MVWIPTTKDILLFRLMMCAIVSFFYAMYSFVLFIDSFFCVSNICKDYFRTSSVFNGKRLFKGVCRSDCCFPCNGVCLACQFMSCLILKLLSWGTTLSCNVCDCWTCVQKEFCLLLIVLLKFCFYSFLSYTPNPYWVEGNLLWCIHTVPTFHHSQYQRHASKQI